MEKIAPRRALANLTLLVFVLSTSYGFYQLRHWAGWVALGATCLVASFLLGSTGSEGSE